MMNKTLVGLLALSLLGGLVAAAPANDRPQEQGTLTLPPGFGIQGSVTKGVFLLQAVPLEGTDDAVPAPMVGGPGELKGCDNDVTGGGGYYFAPVSTMPLLNAGATNRASERECREEMHSGGILFMQFRTTGDHYGSIYAEGCVSATHCGWYEIACAPVGAATGFPDPEGWATLQRGRDTTCKWESFGPQPHEWATWRAWVGNAHVWEGSASVLFL